MRKRDCIAVLGAIALGTILLCIGFFLLCWGAWIYLSGYGTRPCGLEYLMMIFGVSMMIGGIIVVSKILFFAKEN